MNLRTKLTAGFFAVALITLLVSGLGYWQTQKLASALYEVGVVRLSSIQALDSIFEAKTSLDASKRELLRESTLFNGDAAVLAEEIKRQQQAWRRAEKGLKIYEPLPKTAEESAKWQEFVPYWRAWRTSYEKTVSLLEQGRSTGARALIEAAKRENDANLYEPARMSRMLLTELVELNAQIAAETKRASIASARDTQVVRLLMLASAIVSVVGAVACGIVMGRLIGRPAREMADAFSRIAQGDLTTRLVAATQDEFGRMAGAMNRMVESLRTSELRFRAVFENSFDAIGVSKDGRMILANPALLALFRYDREADIVGRSVLEFIAAADHKIILERRRRSERGENLPPMFELTGRRRDGSTFAMEVQAAPFVLAGETHYVAIHRDITERTRAATQLKESAERLELALHTSKLGVWRRHRVARVADWDERVFALFGLAVGPQAPSRETLLELIVPEDREAARRSWSEELAPGRIHRHRVRIQRPDGQVRHLEAHWMVHAGADGAAEWDIGVIGDVTEIVDAAAESTRLREQLLQAQKLETLGTLSAGIAHDFNNLLTSINGFVELAAATVPAGHEAAELLRQARAGTTSARELVRRILTFARQSRESTRAPVGLAGLARDTAPLIAATLPPNVSLALDLAPDSPPVLADAGQIQQVLMNLCTNGAHAIGARTGTLRVGIRAHTFTGAADESLPAGCAAGRYVCLTVTDTGCGMDAATLQRIFEPFFTTKKPGEGTGLGLAIVHDIVATHEGGLAVTSAPGCGTTFSLYFPVVLAPAPTETAAARGLSARGAGQRILVVDDEPAIARVIQIALRKSGYAPEIFTTATEAWLRFAAAPAEFHLLVIDQQMPGLSGADFIGRARELAPALPIIRMSGRFERSLTTAEPGRGGASQLKKPFEIAELLEQVASLLKS